MIWNRYGHLLRIARAIGVTRIRLLVGSTEPPAADSWSMARLGKHLGRARASVYRNRPNGESRTT
jgi:hypothetical protein